MGSSVSEGIESLEISPFSLILSLVQLFSDTLNTITKN